MTKNVVILDANNVISSGGPEVLKRHVDYARELEKQSAGNAKLVIIGNDTLIKNYSQISESDNSSLVVISIGEKRFTKLFFWKYAFTSLKKNKIGVSLLVSGDPWISGLNSVILKCIFLRRKKTLLQIQFHADIFSKGWKTTSIRNYLKFILARFTLLNANLIRTVSKNQTIFLFDYLRKSQKVSCIPVPLIENEILKSKFNESLTSFGFFGRLHKDRGTESLVRIFRKLLTEHPEINLIIGGSGPESQSIENRLAKVFPSQVKMLGNLSSNQAIEFWNQIDVLISLAKYESYGRAPREAVLNQVPVIAFESSGILDLKESQLGDWVELISDAETSEGVLRIAQAVFSRSKSLPKPNQNDFPFNSATMVARDWCEALDLETTLL